MQLSLHDEGLGTIHIHKASFLAKLDTNPKFFKPRPVPFAIHEAVGTQFNKLEENGVVEKVTHNSWAAPVEVVCQKDRHYQLCGDYKVTINKALDVNQYPLHKLEDIFFTTLAGDQKFSKHTNSKPSVTFSTINTHQGLYQ